MLEQKLRSLLAVTIIACFISPVKPDDEVSLVFGPNPYTGLVQITHANRTGLVCDDGFNMAAARVVCRQLDYPTINPVVTDAGGFLHLPKNMSFVMDDLVCQGGEAQLADCKHADWFNENCGNDETVAVTCENNPCKVNPCQNGGSCTKVTGTLFTCVCTRDFTGKTCGTDINECSNLNGGCSHKCVNDFGGFHCECPDVELDLSPDNHTCVALGETVECTSQTMTITFEKSRFPGLQAKYVTLSDPTCHATENATHIIVTSPLGLCGTTSKNTGTSIVYENTVKSQEVIVDGVISRVRDIRVPYQCIVPVAESLEVPLIVDRSVLTFTAESRGEFDTRLELFHDPNYLIHAAKPFFADPGDLVNAELSIISNGSDLTPMAFSCAATPTQNMTYHVYHLIDHGCGSDSTVRFHPTPDITKEHFSFEAFKYLDNSPAVFLHCNVVVCLASDNSSLCSQGCQTTPHGKRSLTDLEDFGIERVHHQYMNHPESDAPRELRTSSVVMATGVVAFLVSSVFLLSVVIIKKKTNNNQTYKTIK